MSDDTFVDVAFHYDPKGNLGSGSFKIYVDDALVATQTTLTNVPDDIGLGVQLGTNTKGTTTTNLMVDYVKVLGERVS